MRLKALLVDVDGTLVDTENLHRIAFNQAFSEFGLDWEWGLARYAELLSVSGGAERIAAWIDGLKLPVWEKIRLRRLVPAIHAVKTRIYAELLGSGAARARTGVERIIEEAADGGLKVGIVVSSSMRSAHTLLAMVLGQKARAAISVVVGVEQVARKKPAPDVYELALATLQVPAEAAIALEDSANGVAAAKAAGLCVIATPSRWTLSQTFGQADLLLPSLGDPSEPLDPSVAVRIGGAPYVSLAHLEALHAYHRCR